MKKIIVMALTVTAFASAQAFAAHSKHAKQAKHEAPATYATQTQKQWSRPYGMAGCGLGSMAMGNSGNQIFASTTNGTFGSQTFGITTGTSNCMDDPNTAVASRMDHFVAGNTVAVAGDIARGDGETVVSMSNLLGCSDSVALGSALQKNFHQIFPSHEVVTNHVTDAIITVIKNDSQLRCTNVI